MPYTTILLIICCAVFYYRLGEAEYVSGRLLALISVGVWIFGIFALQLGSVGNLFLQVGLFIGLLGVECDAREATLKR